MAMFRTGFRTGLATRASPHPTPFIDLNPSPA
jgi:hypothetical protein